MQSAFPRSFGPGCSGDYEVCVVLTSNTSKRTPPDLDLSSWKKLELSEKCAVGMAFRVSIMGGRRFHCMRVRSTELGSVYILCSLDDEVSTRRSLEKPIPSNPEMDADPPAGCSHPEMTPCRFGGSLGLMVHFGCAARRCRTGAMHVWRGTAQCVEPPQTLFQPSQSLACSPPQSPAF
jgi:hypothetical protein